MSKKKADPGVLKTDNQPQTTLAIMRKIEKKHEPVNRVLHIACAARMFNGATNDEERTKWGALISELQPKAKNLLEAELGKHTLHVAEIPHLVELAKIIDAYDGRLQVAVKQAWQSALKSPYVPPYSARGNGSGCQIIAPSPIRKGHEMIFQISAPIC